MATLRATFHGITSQMSGPGYEYYFIDVASAQREVKHSRRSGEYQSYYFLTRLGKQVRAELVRDRYPFRAEPPP